MKKKMRYLNLSWIFMLAVITGVGAFSFRDYIRPGFRDRETLPDTDMVKNESLREPKNFILRILGFFINFNVFYSSCLFNCIHQYSESEVRISSC